MNHSICVIGSGNVATALAIAFYKKKYKIAEVYSPNIHHAKVLAKKVNTTIAKRISDITTQADVYLVSVKDDALVEVLGELDAHLNKKIILHTSGTVPLIKSKKNAMGVFYPLQTFSKLNQPELNNVPICIESANAKAKKLIKAMAAGVSKKVVDVNSEKRKVLHLAAVFACNFTNALYEQAASILKQKDLPFDILYPLVIETAAKVMKLNPVLAQTGPAKRGDKKIMGEHIKMLKKDKEAARLYKQMSKLIANQQRNK